MEDKLFNIAQEIKEAFDLITQHEGEITSEIEEKLTIAQNALVKKTDNCVLYRDKFLMYLAHIDGKMEEMQHHRNQINRSLSKFDDYVLNCLKQLPSRSTQGEFSSIKIRKPSKIVEIFDESLIPIEFVKIPEPKPSIVKTDIAKELKAGKEVQGARLVDGKESLIYKVGRE